MAHKHDGTLYYIVVDNKTNECLYDDWADVLTFNSEEEAQEYIEDYELEETHHIETWLDY